MLTNSHRIKIFIFLSGAFAWHGSTSAQHSSPRFQHLTVEDGLSASEVNAIYKDRIGCMWFGTPAGLNRYDGTHFRVYRNNPKDPHSLSGDFVRAIAEDALGNLWIGTYDGLNRYDREHDNFTSYKSNPADRNSLVFNYIHALFTCRHGRLWIGTYQGLDRLDPAGGTFTHYLHDPKNPDTPSSNRILGICEDDQGAIWFCTDKGLNRLDESTGRITRFVHDPRDPGSLGSNLCTHLFKDEKGRIWIATMDRGVDEFDPKTGRFTHYRHGKNNPNSLAVDRIQHLAGDGKGLIFIGTQNGGLDILNLKTRRITHCLPDFNDENSLNSASIPSLYHDPNGILWIGTFNGGVNLLCRQSQGFKVVRAGAGRLNNPSTMAFLEDRSGNLWIATDGGGLNFLDRKTGQFRSFFFDPDNPASLSSNAVTSVIEDRRGDIWAGTFGGGLNRLNGRRDGFVRYTADPGDPSRLPDNNVYWIVESRSGELLLANHTAVTRFDPRTGSFKKISDLQGIERIVSSIQFVAVDGKENLWIGTYDDGACRIDLHRNTLTSFRHDPEDPGSLRNNRIHSIYSDSRNHLWIGTSRGLHLLDAKSGKFKAFTVSDGLPSDQVAGILEDNRGNLWLSTGRGLCEFQGGVISPSQPHFKNYDILDGLQGDEFRPRSAYRSRSGELFFGGNRGFNRFYPGDIMQNPVVPNVVLTGLKIYDRTADVGVGNSPLEKRIGETDALVLSYRQSAFTIEFAALNYVLPGKNQYAYRLDGFEKDWNDAGTRHEATYTNLNPGNYVFRVKASNNDGLWNEQDVSLKIRIVPPFWRTAWFTILALAAAAGTGFLLHRRSGRKRRIGEEVRMDAALTRERNLLRALIDHIPDLIYVKDRESRFLSCNQETLRRMGAAGQEQIIGKTDFDFRPRDAAEKVYADEQRIMEAGQPVVNREEFMTDAAGRTTCMLTTKVPLADGHGLVTGLVGIGVDITERKRMEEALKQEQNLMRSLMDNMPDHIFFKDSQSRFIRTNAAHARMLGLSDPREVAGKTDFDLFSQAFARKMFEQEQEIIRTGEPLIGRILETVYQSGRHLWLSETKMPLRDENGRIIGVMGLSRDITDLKNSEAALRRNEEIQRAFSERLTRVLEAVNVLSKIGSADELSRRSVELAIERLGFDRIGLWFLSEDKRTMLGAYGTDEKGALRDERALRKPVDRTTRITIEGKEPVVLFEHNDLLNDKGEAVGSGTQAVARLSNGEEIIGAIGADNLIRGHPVTEQDRRILVLYATALAHLFTLRRAEAALVESGRSRKR